jgi:hypothetical protein
LPGIVEGALQGRFTSDLGVKQAQKGLGTTVCTHKHRHPPAPCEQGFLPENIACLSGLGQGKTENGVAVFMRAYGMFHLI